jgi:NADH-quinone oxidoreductase subunit A
MEQDPLWPLLFFSAAVLTVVATMLILPAVLGERHWAKPERRRDVATAVPYESGIRPTGTAQIRLPIQYYVIAMFFVIFDVEAVFLYAWAVVVREAGWLGFAEVAIFAGVLLAAWAYLLLIGALDWNIQYQRPAVHRLHHRVTPQEDRDALVA